MTERETGEIIATQKAMATQLNKLEKSVNALHKQQGLLVNKLSVGKGVAITLVASSGVVGAVVTVLLTKMTGGP